MSYEVATFFFPGYHADLRNDQWHGQGWTEWDLLREAKPRYVGHQQPKVPAWGEFDESNPQWSAREIDLAADHGITTFIYDWYWYDDAPFLNRALEQGFLRAPNRNRLKFALMWANHTWNNMFPARLTNRPEHQCQGSVDAASFERIVEYALAHYFAQPNYLRIDGRLFFSIYELGTFIHGLGGLDAAAQAIRSMRDRCQRAGLGDVHLNVIVWQLAVLPTELKLPNVEDVVKQLGVDSVTSYTWVHHYDPNAHGFPVGSYAHAAEANYQIWNRYANTLPVPYFPNVSMGWDPSPRTCQTDRFEKRSYPWTAVLEGNTPEAFAHAMRKAIAHVDQLELRPKLITLNAWNEWTEGSYLLPDQQNGKSYLEALRDVLAESKPVFNRQPLV